MNNLFNAFLFLLIVRFSSEQCADTNCGYCPDENICEECDTDFYLVLTDGTCVDSQNCPEGTVALNGEPPSCTCEIPCFTCSVVGTNCTDCSSQYLYENQCLDQCPEGAYDPDAGNEPASAHGWVCLPCDSSCNSCYQNATSCTSCSDSSKFALNYACVDASTCEQNNKYGDLTSHSCESCLAPCLTCSQSANNCTSCVQNQGKFLEGNECVEACSLANYFENEADGFICSVCDKFCAECHITAIQCTKCPEADGTYLQSSDETCVVDCEAGTFKNSSDTTNKLCSACLDPCSECQDSDSTCTRCSETSGLFLLGNTCIDTCGNDEYKNSTTIDNKLCSKCINNCATCDTETFCKTCTTSGEFYLTPENTCEEVCPDGTFKNSSNVNDKICSPCKSPCENCEGTDITCTSCVINYYFYLPNNTCHEICPSQTFQTGLNCEDCDKDNFYCSECSGVNNNCTKCTEDSNTYLSENSCLIAADCPVGTYPDKTSLDDKQCKQCPENCSACNTFTECTSCKSESNQFLYQGNCLDKCPSGTYSDDTDNNNRICVNCQSPCKECEASPDNCLECTQESSLYLKENECVSKCDTGYYIDSEVAYKLCTLCVAPCVECTSANYCSRCDSSQEQYLYLNSCTDTCPLKTFKNSTDPDNKKCSDCPASCANCSDYQTCHECTATSGLYLWENKCIVGCPEGTYLDTSLEYFGCAYCVAPCIACESGTHCTKCNNSYLNANACVDECPSKTFKDDTDLENLKCSTCFQDCAECTESQYKCLKCVPSLYLYDNSCYKAMECPAHTFANSTTADDGLCSVCNSPCSECSADADSCTKCLEGTNTYLISSLFTCVLNTECPNGTYADKTDLANKQCLDCNPPCATCLTSRDFCLSCTAESNTYLSENSCVAQCPDGFWGNDSSPANKFCVDCQSPCATCTLDGCTKCEESSNLYLNGLECIIDQDCPLGTFADNSVPSDRKCSSCLAPCAFCHGKADYCLSCTDVSLKYVHQGQCLDACPKGTFADENDPSFRQCIQCEYPCSECTSTECTLCDESSGAMLINGKCLYECPQGYYLTNIEGVDTCELCSLPCAECYDAPDACTRCAEQSGLYLLGIQCVVETECPADHYPDNQDPQNRLCQPIDPVNTIYSYKTIAVAAMIAFVIFIYTTMIKI